MEPIEEDPLEFEKQEEILQLEQILRHENNLLRSGKVLQKYLVKYKNYPLEDAKWMQEPQLDARESLAMLQGYKLLSNLENV